jgi:uncharacterized membrane protein
MAVGAMSVVAPIAGLSAAVPVAFGLATGDHPSSAQIAGIVLALTGVGLASREHQAGRTQVAAGVGLALLAALGFGGYFVPMHAAGEADFWWASLIFRSTSFLLIAVTALALRTRVRLSGGDTAYVAAVGLGDMLGNLLFAASSKHGLVSVTSVLASLYPIVTVLLARVVLHERVDRVQELGVVATLAGVVLISAGLRPEPPQHEVLARDERRRGRMNSFHKVGLRVERLLLRLEQLSSGIEVLQELELELRLECEQPVADRVAHALLRVGKVDVEPVRLLDHAELLSAGLDPLLVDRVQVDERPTRNEKPMDVAQGVHDALTFDSSQRPGEEREVEACGRRVHLLRSANGERDLLREASRL